MVFKNLQDPFIVRVICLALSIFLLFLYVKGKVIHCPCHRGSGSNIPNWLLNQVS